MLVSCALQSGEMLEAKSVEDDRCHQARKKRCSSVLDIASRSDTSTFDLLIPLSIQQNKPQSISTLHPSIQRFQPTTPIILTHLAIHHFQSHMPSDGLTKSTLCAATVVTLAQIDGVYCQLSTKQDSAFSLWPVDMDAQPGSPATQQSRIASNKR